MPEEKQAEVTESPAQFVERVMGIGEQKPPAGEQGQEGEQEGQEQHAEGEEGQEQEQQEQEGQEGEESDEFDPVLKLGEDEIYDLRKKEGRDKILEHAKLWKEAQPKLTDIENKQTEVKTEKDNMMTAIKYMYSQTLFQDLNEGNLVEKPFEMYLEEAEGDKKQAMKLLGEDRSKIARINEFGNNFTEASKKFVGIKSEFKTNHPEIADVDKWVSENLNPYIESITSFGEKPMKQDTLEMLHFWANKDKIFKDFKDKVLKDYVKRPPATPAKTGNTIKANTTPKNIPKSAQKIEDALTKMGKKYEGRKILMDFPSESR